MNFKHGKAKTPIHCVWRSMIDRCTNPRCVAYPNYGGRGISVCPQWLDFTSFYADMGDRPKGMTLERIDNNSGYSPENCRWATRADQGRNKRNNLVITIDGESAPLSAWAERFGIPYGTAHRRIVCGWGAEEAVKTPVVRARAGITRGMKVRNSSQPKVEYCGEMLPLDEAARKAGINYATLMTRLRRGWPVAVALSEPPKKGPHSFGAQHGVVFSYGENAA